jgi:hypothetical protein
MGVVCLALKSRLDGVTASWRPRQPSSEARTTIAARDGVTPIIEEKDDELW